jgi:hypothetical protein
MGVKTLGYAQPLTQDTSRGPSGSIWDDFPCEDALQGRGGSAWNMSVMEFFFNFGEFAFPTLNAQAASGPWSIFADTGTTFVDENEEGGAVIGTNASTSKGFTMAPAAGKFKMVSGATNFPLGQKLWFECRVAMGAISGSTEGYFIGLADNTSSQIASANNTILATTANTFTGTKGLFGFTRFESAPTDWAVKYQVAGGSTVAPTGLSTLVTTVTGTSPTAYTAVTNGNGTGFYKLGFKFDPNPNPAILCSTASGDGTVTQTVGSLYKPCIQFYVNGQLCSTFLDPSLLQTSRFPTKRMAPCISFMDASGGGGSATGLVMDWIRVGQIGSF